MDKTITIDETTWEQLSLLKLKKKHVSLNDVIWELLNAKK